MAINAISALRHPGIVAAIRGVEQIEKLKDVVHADVAHDPGNALTESDKGTLKQISCRFIGVSENKKNMCHTNDQIIKTFYVVDESGNSLLLPQIDFNRYLDMI